MSVHLQVFKKHHIARSKEYKRVKEIADEFHAFLNSRKVQRQILETHKFNAKSGAIQDIFRDKVEEFGFLTEKKGLFSSYQTAALRPDYFLRLSDSAGILLEVERGKTVVNNMDLLDLWKCHICDHANYLFLVVPQVRHSGGGKLRTTYPKVVKRIESFFVKKNYINVDAVFIYGY